MKKRYTFTLVELLVVIAIIAILAGLVIPAVLLGQQKGRVTQAKADMNSILIALKQVETTYQKMANPNSNQFGGQSAKAAKIDGTAVGYKLGGEAVTSSSNPTAYDYFIIELTDPTAANLTAQNININSRRMRFLDPRSSYDPTQSVRDNVRAKQLWLDPWGNQYVVMINTDYTDRLPNPIYASSANNDIDSSRVLSAKAAAYSLGPNGSNDGGKNASEGTGTNNEDDIVSWQ